MPAEVPQYTNKHTIVPQDGDHVLVDADLPYMGLKEGDLTIQQEKLVLYVCSGMTIAAASRAAGYKSPESAAGALRNPKIRHAVDYYRAQFREDVKFTVVDAHHLYMDAYAASANATEMRTTVDSLVKLHGLAKEQDTPVVNININGTKQLERMTDDELLQLVGKDAGYLEPVEDAEFDEFDEFDDPDDLDEPDDPDDDV